MNWEVTTTITRNGRQRPGARVVVAKRREAQQIAARLGSAYRCRAVITRTREPVCPVVIVPHKTLAAIMFTRS